jgi:hypothetical protein
MARPRSPFGSVLSILAGLAIALGIVGWWIGHTVGDADAFASLAGDLLQEDAIVSSLASAIVHPALANATPEVKQQRAVILATTEAVLRDERFVPLFEDVLRQAHHDLFDGKGDVRLELGPALASVITQVRPISPQVADQLAAVPAPHPVVIAAAEADRVRSLVGFERAATIAFLVGGLILVVIAVIGAGPRALVPFGVTLAVACILFLLLMFGARGLLGLQVSGDHGEAATSAFGVVLAGLRTTLIVATLVGVGSAVVGVVLGRR